MIREGNPDDFGAATELLNREWPGRVGSERGLRHAAASEPPEAHRGYWAAEEEEGRLVGWATAVLSYESSASAASVQVCVASNARRRGLGTALLARCETHVAPLGAETVSASTTPDEASQAFASRNGFRHTHTIRISGLDPRTQEPPAAPEGVELRSLAELGPEAVFELDCATMLDVPGDVPMDAVSYDQWLEDYWRHPDMDFEASVAAVVEGKPVSFSLLRVTPDGLAVSDMTGTLGSHRGRGLAVLVKRATLANAAARGVELVVTDNHETNPAMLRVNELLGYRPVGSWLIWARP